MLLLKCKYLYNKTEVRSKNARFMQNCVFTTIRAFVQIGEKKKINHISDGQI
jgi:hypothetical protein